MDFQKNFILLRYLFLGTLFCVSILFFMPSLKAEVEFKFTKRNCRKEIKELKGLASLHIKERGAILRFAICTYELKYYRASGSKKRDFLDAHRRLSDDDFRYSNFNRSRILWLLGRNYVALKKYKKAERVLTEVMRDRDNIFAALANYWLAELYYKTGRKRQSRYAMKTFMNRARNLQAAASKYAYEDREMRHLLRKARKQLKRRRRKRRNIRERRWEVNNAEVAETEVEANIWDFVYVGGVLGHEFFLKDFKDPNGTVYGLFDENTVSEQEFSGRFMTGFGPFQTHFVTSRFETNVYSDFYTDYWLMSEYFANQGEFFFSNDRYHLSVEGILDQQIRLDVFEAGYNFLYRDTFVHGRGHGQRRILPWMAMRFAEQFRTRLFYSFEFHPNFVNALETHRVGSLHFGQDFYSNEWRTNLNLEIFRRVVDSHSTLVDRSSYGGQIIVDSEIVEDLIFRSVAIVRRATWSDPRLRLLTREQSIVLDIRDDRLVPGELTMRTTEINLELLLAYYMGDYQRLSFTGFYASLATNLPKDIGGYDEKNYGMRFEYRLAYPGLRRVREKIRDGFYGLF